MKKIFGSTTGLSASQLKALEALYHFNTRPEDLISREQLEALVAVSTDIRRQVGVLIARNGKTVNVIAGEPQRIIIPDTPDFRTHPGRLKGIRFIHTRLNEAHLTREDLTDLALLRLDFLGAVSVFTSRSSDQTGIKNGEQENFPVTIYPAHILPGDGDEPYTVISPLSPDDLNIGCIERIEAIEDELSRQDASHKVEKGEERALLINVFTDHVNEAVASLEELKELCRSSDIRVLDTVLQRRKKIDPKFVVGRGKLSDLVIRALQKHATMLLFDRELTPSQIRSITDFVEMKVIDRTQLILDIFARRAKSREGKLQVELAQMNYLLPRLATKNTAMSRLTGGIGGRGPGETKLEINRRRAREKISRLTKEIDKIRKQRTQQRSKRNRTGIPVISIVGYTNAGKSTLLNTLTKSDIIAENRLFATLDPSSRRLRFPRELEVIITDTVGFIQDLPEELMEAFHATLEELKEADILLHVVDISNPRYEQQMSSVEKILKELGLEQTPVVYVFNKQDKIKIADFDNPWLLNQGTLVSATRPETLKPLVNRLESMTRSMARSTS
ncbi:MAG: GTPase HflX [Desulfobacterium sp.]|jgi:GTP-binding protein HflX|nr:GTPase HflX [Desulfobacterium sp.]